MNTLKTIRVRLAALAIACLALTGVARAPVHAADARPVMPLNGWNGRVGPGGGTMKNPFLVVEVGRSSGGRTDDTTYCHTSKGKPVQQVPINHMGPGPWSSKSPFSGRDYNVPR